MNLGKRKAWAMASHHCKSGPQREPTKAAKRVKRSVRFAEDRNLVARQQPVDIEQAWYLPEDYRRIKEEARETIAAAAKAGGDFQSLESDAKNQLCLRGLEDLLFPIRRQKRKERNRNVILAVLAHQRLYAKLRVPTDEIAKCLRGFYRIATVQSSDKAHAMALLDSASTSMSKFSSAA